MRLQRCARRTLCFSFNKNWFWLIHSQCTIYHQLIKIVSDGNLHAFCHMKSHAWHCTKRFCSLLKLNYTHQPPSRQAQKWSSLFSKIQFNEQRVDKDWGKISPRLKIYEYYTADINFEISRGRTSGAKVSSAQEEVVGFRAWPAPQSNTITMVHSTGSCPSLTRWQMDLN